MQMNQRADAPGQDYHEILDFSEMVDANDLAEHFRQLGSGDFEE
jgi:hypothetical protein